MTIRHFILSPARLLVSLYAYRQVSNVPYLCYSRLLYMVAGEHGVLGENALELVVVESSTLFGNVTIQCQRMEENTVKAKGFNIDHAMSKTALKIMVSDLHKFS